jgi:hypothetical protein
VLNDLYSSLQIYKFIATKIEHTHTNNRYHMKPIYLLTGLLAWTTLVVTSCSAPRMAQQASVNDDVYNSTARAVEYQKPSRTQAQQYLDEDTSYTEEDYGTSDPYADMDYSSRINRFYYGGPFRSYYDPYFDGFYGYNPYYSGFSLGMGFGGGFGGGFGYGGWGGSFMGGYWGPYSGFGSFYNPYWGYGGWPYGGGFYGGGYFGGGYYGGGYGGSRGNVAYGGRPSRGRENGVGYTRTNSGFGTSGATRTSNGNVISGRSRSERYGVGRGVTTGNPNRGATLDARTRVNSGVGRPTRSGEVTPNRSTRPPERYNAPTRSERPTYSAPSNYGGGGRSSGGGGGGASRPSRGGGRG